MIMCTDVIEETMQAWWGRRNFPSRVFRVLPHEDAVLFYLTLRPSYVWPHLCTHFLSQHPQHVSRQAKIFTVHTGSMQVFAPVASLMKNDLSLVLQTHLLQEAHQPVLISPMFDSQPFNHMILYCTPSPIPKFFWESLLPLIIYESWCFFWNLTVSNTDPGTHWPLINIWSVDWVNTITYTFSLPTLSLALLALPAKKCHPKKNSVHENSCSPSCAEWNVSS